MINNISIKGLHEEVINFCLKQVEIHEDFSPIAKDKLIEQINSADVSIESTPYYCIIKFYYNGYSSLSFNQNILIQVIPETVDKPVPKAFLFHLYDNILYEFEYYVADSSEICEKNLLIGKVLFDV